MQNRVRLIVTNGYLYRLCLHNQGDGSIEMRIKRKTAYVSNAVRMVNAKY